MSKYTLTKEHEAQLPAWRDRWIENALSTKAMDDNDRDIMRKSIKGLYEAANLTPPPPNRIVFVSSPFIARFTTGFAAALWYNRKEENQRINIPKIKMTTDNVYNEIYNAVRLAVTENSKDESILTPVKSTFNDKNNNDWFVFPNKSALKVANDLNIGEFGMKCAENSWKLSQGGNFWSAWDSFLSFFKDVVKLPLDYSKYEHWQKAAEHGSYRQMHENFCVISDRPDLLVKDAQHRPHNATGPFCSWRDGSCLYALDGVYVPQWVVETPAKYMDPKRVMEIKNVDARAKAIKKIGAKSMLDGLGSNIIDTKTFAVGGTYTLHAIKWTEQERRYLQMTNPSTGETHVEAVPPECETVDMAMGARAEDIIGDTWKNKDFKYLQPKWHV